MTRLIIDTDMASDDAVALLMALGAPGVTIEAITCVAGYMPVEGAVQNTLYLLERAGRLDIPVYAGRPAPVIKPYKVLGRAHGEDGLGDIGLPVGGRSATPGNAVIQMVRLINENPGQITLAPIGPLTNIAVAVLLDPSIVTKVAGCYVMGGSAGAGNVTAAAEANAWQDPDAAAIVFASGMPVTMVGWDMCVEVATYPPADVSRIRAAGPAGELSMDMQSAMVEYVKQHRGHDFVLADVLAVALALDPSLGRTERFPVVVEVNPGLCEGQTLVDRRGNPDAIPNVEVLVDVDRERFIRLMVETLSRVTV